jgi:molecular chaperone DnaK
MSPDPDDPSSKVDLERRRVPLERKVSLKFKEFRGFITEYSQNLSMGGMFIRTTSPKPVGTIFDFELSLTDDFKLVQGIGEVLWVRDVDDGPERPSGMGVRFLDLSSESRRLIQRIVEEQVAHGGTPFELEPPGFPPPPLRSAQPAAAKPGAQSTLFHPSVAPLAPSPPLPSRPRPSAPALTPISSPRPRPATAPAAPPIAPTPTPLVAVPEPRPFAVFQDLPDLGPPELPVPDLPPQRGDVLPDLQSLDALESETFEGISLVDDDEPARAPAAAPESFALPDVHHDPTPLQAPPPVEEPPAPWATAPAPPHLAGTHAPPRGRGLPSGFDEVARAFSERSPAGGDRGEVLRMPPLDVPPEPVRPTAPPRPSSPEPPRPRVAAAAPPVATPAPLERRPPRRRRSWAPLIAALVVLLLGGFAVLYLRFPELLPVWAGGGEAGPAESTAPPPAPGGGAAMRQQAARPPGTEAGAGVAPAPVPATSPGAPATTTAPAASPPAPAPSEPVAAPPSERPDRSAAAQAALGGDGPRTRFTTVEEIWGQRSPLGTVVTIVTNGAVPPDAFSHFRLEGANPREVIRLRGVDDRYRRSSVAVSTAEVKQVRLGYHAKPEGNELHVVIDLTSPRVTLLRTTPVDNRLELLFAAQ